MTESMDGKQLNEQLNAFADGELQGDAHRQMLEHVAANPQARQRVLRHQQMRDAVKRSTLSDAPAAPTSLRRQIEQLTSPTTASTPAPPAAQSEYQGPSVLARLGVWVPAAVAALLFLSTVIILQNGRGTVDGHNVANASLISPASIQLFEKRHVACTRMLASIRDADKFPTQLSELPAVLSQHFGTSNLPSLDLSSLGYEFHQAGNCKVPGSGAIHMMYRAMPSTGRDDAISLWIRKYEGAPDIEAGRLYEVDDPAAIHPILLWRQADMIYYLVGDARDPAEQAARQVMQGQ